MLIDLASPSLIITEQYSTTYFQFLFYVSKKKQAVKNFQRKNFKKLYQWKNARIDKKNVFLLEPEPEKKIQNGSGSGSKGPKKPGSETLEKFISNW